MHTYACMYACMHVYMCVWGEVGEGGGGEGASEKFTMFLTRGFRGAGGRC